MTGLSARTNIQSPTDFGVGANERSPIIRTRGHIEREVMISSAVLLLILANTRANAVRP